MLKKWMLSTFEIKIKLRGVYMLLFVTLLIGSIFVYKSIAYNNAHAVLPNFIGMTLSEAEVQLDTIGVKFKTKEVISNVIVSGTVVAQSPAIGTKIGKDEIISIDVCKREE
ncbi:MAG TPA: PASTA domain-containing protein [Clostridiaceae bacterium]